MTGVVFSESKLNVWASFSNLDDKRWENDIRPVLEANRCAAVTFNLLSYLGKDILKFPESNQLLFLDAAVIMLSKNYLTDLWLCSELNAFMKRGQVLRRPFAIPIFLDDVVAPGLNELLSDCPCVYCSDSEWKEKLVTIIDVIRSKPKLLVFISYNKDDISFVEPFANLMQDVFGLGDRQIRCAGTSKYGLSAGEVPDDLLRREVYDAKLVIGILSPNSLDKTYVMFELGARWGAGGKILPVVAGGLIAEQVSRPLNLFTSLSLDYPDHIARLMFDIASELGRPEPNLKDHQERIIRIAEQSSKAASNA